MCRWLHPNSPSITNICYYHLLPFFSFLVWFRLNPLMPPSETETFFGSTVFKDQTCFESLLKWYICWISFFSGSEAVPAVVFYCNCRTICFVVQVRDQNKSSEIWCPVSVLKLHLCCWGEKRISARVATEEATTIKFNKVLVTDKGMLAVCWPSAIQPQTQTTCLVSCEPIHKQRKDTQTHGPFGCLHCTETLPASSCLYIPKTFMLFKWKYVFPINQKQSYQIWVFPHLWLLQAGWSQYICTFMSSHLRISLQAWWQWHSYCESPLQPGPCFPWPSGRSHLLHIL